MVAGGSGVRPPLIIKAVVNSSQWLWDFKTTLIPLKIGDLCFTSSLSEVFICRLCYVYAFFSGGSDLNVGPCINYAFIPVN